MLTDTPEGHGSQRRTSGENDLLDCERARIFGESQISSGINYCGGYNESNFTEILSDDSDEKFECLVNRLLRRRGLSGARERESNGGRIAGGGGVDHGVRGGTRTDAAGYELSEGWVADNGDQAGCNSLCQGGNVEHEADGDKEYATCGVEPSSLASAAATRSSTASISRCSTELRDSKPSPSVAQGRRKVRSRAARN